jgi:hypothetical protein
MIIIFFFFDFCWLMIAIQLNYQSNDLHLVRKDNSLLVLDVRNRALEFVLNPIYLSLIDYALLPYYRLIKFFLPTIFALLEEVFSSISRTIIRYDGLLIIISVGL